MVDVAEFEHLIGSYDISDLLDDIASADPPAYLRRCFAEGSSAPVLSWNRIQQLAACAIVVDCVADGRDYEAFEAELIADWRMHYAQDFAKLKEPAAAALHRAQGEEAGLKDQPDAAPELRELERRLTSA